MDEDLLQCQTKLIFGLLSIVSFKMFVVSILHTFSVFLPQTWICFIIRAATLYCMYTMPHFPVVRAQECTVVLVEPITSIVQIQISIGDPFVWARQDITGA